MAKLTDFETPLGQKGNILNPMSWWSLILGTIVLLATFSLGEKIGGRVGAKIPALNTQPQYPFAPIPQPAPVSSVEYIN